MPINVPAIGGSAPISVGASVSSGVNYGPFPQLPLPVILLPPVQVAGLVQMISCTDDECRSWNECCYENIVFGTTPGGATVDLYENDVNTFLVNYQIAGILSIGGTVTWTLQEKVNGTWTDIASLNNQTYGVYYAINSLPIKTYTMVELDWGKVLDAFGEGVFRVKALATNLSYSSPCIISEAFCLREYSCKLADKTVKFEALMTGKIGDINTDGKVFDLCGFTLYDSIRIPAFFGYETTEYDETLLEYGTGLIERVRDEAIQKFQFKTRARGLPKPTLDRLKIYAFMCDNLKVSDYNYNNSDYNIRRKNVIKAGGFAPNYKTTNRMASVTVDFKEGIEQVIKSKCCTIRPGVGN